MVFEFCIRSLYMNDTIYKDIIVSWVPIHERCILQQKDWWLIPIRRIIRDKHYCAFLVDIWLHGGTPCNHRYCICTYFALDDKAGFCRDYTYFYPHGKSHIYHLWKEKEKEKETEGKTDINTE